MNIMCVRSIHEVNGHLMINLMSSMLEMDIFDKWSDLSSRAYGIHVCWRGNFLCNMWA